MTTDMTPLGRMSELHCTGACQKTLENTTLDFSECNSGHNPHERSASAALDTAREKNILEAQTVTANRGLLFHTS